MLSGAAHTDGGTMVLRDDGMEKRPERVFVLLYNPNASTDGAYLEVARVLSSPPREDKWRLEQYFY